MREKLVFILRKNSSLILLFFIVIVPFITLSYFLLYDNFQYRYAEEQKKNLQIAEVLAQEMDEYVGRIKHTLENIGTLKDFQTQNQTEIEQTFATLALDQGDVSLFWITKASGELIAKYPEYPEVKSSTTAAGREFFLQAMQGKSYVSDDYLVGDITGKEIIVVAVPYKDVSGKIAGVLAASIPLEKLQQRLMINVGSTGYPIMVSKSGRFLAHPKLDLVRQKVKDDDPIWQAIRSGGSKTVELVAPLDGQHKFFSYVTLKEAPWIVVVVQPLGELNAKLHDLFTRYGVVIIVVFLLAILAARRYLVARNAEEAARILQSEKLAAVGQLAAGMAHEIRNPLTTIKGFVQLIAERDGQFLPEYLDLIQQEIESIQGVVEGTLVLAKPHPEFFTKVDLRNVAESVCTLMEPQAVNQDIKISLSCPTPLPEIDAQPNLLKMVFVNLIKNSMEAIPQGKGQINIELRQFGEKVQISVQDSGEGMTANQLKNLGSPFLTTKENGTGLGLTVTYRIIQNHGGSIQVVSSPGCGTTFVITLPIHGRNKSH